MFGCGCLVFCCCLVGLGFCCCCFCEWGDLGVVPALLRKMVTNSLPYALFVQTRSSLPLIAAFYKLSAKKKLSVFYTTCVRDVDKLTVLCTLTTKDVRGKKGEKKRPSPAPSVGRLLTNSPFSVPLLRRTRCSCSADSMPEISQKQRYLTISLFL